MRTKKYVIELVDKGDGKVSLDRTCDGFTGHELLGLLWETQQDILAQMRGERPIYDVVNRKVVKEGIEDIEAADE